MKRLFILLSAVVLTACATPYDLLRNYAGADAGTVAASVGMTSANTMNFATIEFRRKNTTDMAKLEFSPKAAAAFGGTSVDVSGPAGSSALVQKRLPPGDYEIIRYASGANYGSSMVWYAAPEDFTLPFTVKSGEVVYLGQLLVGLNMVSGRPTSSFLEITDQSARDLPKLGTTGANARNEAAALVRGAPAGTRRLN
jgi:hypothetical protein